MSIESGPNPEEVREAYIVNELKSISPEQVMWLLSGDPDPTRAIPREQLKELNAWIDEVEARQLSMDAGTDEAVEYTIETEIQRADFYHHSGLHALERQTLEDLKYVAENFMNEVALERIDKRLADLDNLR